jgi:hypothetical protein
MVNAIMITDVAHADRTLVQPTFNKCYRQNDLFHLSHLHTELFTIQENEGKRIKHKRHHMWRWHFYIVSSDSIVAVVTKATRWMTWVQILVGTRDLSILQMSRPLCGPPIILFSEFRGSSHHLMPRLSISGTTCPVPLYGVQRVNFYLFTQSVICYLQQTQTHHSVPELCL